MRWHSKGCQAVSATNVAEGKGSRGLHVSEALHDVELAQDHLVGFSANLRYGVVRTGTFQPYLFKKESLLRDVIRSGQGVVLTEEASSLAKGGGGGHRSRHGLEDALDIVLKFFACKHPMPIPIHGLVSTTF